MNEHDSNINKVEKFLSLVKTTKEIIDQLKDYYKEESESELNLFDPCNVFNLCDPFWGKINENIVSSIIAFFLNPDEKHNQGDVYLRHFIEKFKLDFFQFNEKDRITVECEYSINGGRIDIIIYKNNFEQVIAIENKFFSTTPDQKNQIKDYLGALGKNFNNYCLLYLCPQGKIPSEESISQKDREDAIKEGKLKIITYEEHMIECLAEFADKTNNNKVKLFLKDFVRKLKEQYMCKENFEVNGIAHLIKEDEERIEMSFWISKAWHEVEEKLKEEFASYLEDIGKEFGLNINNKGSIIHLERSFSEECKMRISFSYEDGHLYYGVKRDDEDKDKTEFCGIKELREKIDKNFKATEWWAAYAIFYENIENKPDFWRHIKNGNAKARAEKFIELICENFNDAKCWEGLL